MFQQRDAESIDFREGVKIVVQQESLFGEDSGVERVYPPMSRPPPAHAAQARRLLALICGIQNPDEMKITDLTPSADFLVGKAVERMTTAAIYSPGIVNFALMVNSWFDHSVDPDANPDDPPKPVYPGLRWMPLHVISFGATFVRSFSVIVSSFLFLTFYF